MAKFFSTKASDDSAFISDMFASTLLEEAIDWIEAKYTPEQIFGDERLKEWAEEQGVENVFDDAILEMWAQNNGWSKE
jgi:hypothetical protein